MPTQNKTRDAIQIEDELDLITEEQRAADFAFRRDLAKAQRDGWSSNFREKKTAYVKATNERLTKKASLLEELDALAS